MKSQKLLKYRFIILSAIILVLFSAGLSFAANVTFIKEYTYQASEIDSKVTARAIALEQVKRLVLEELGTYLMAETEVKNFQLTKDKVVVLAAGIVQTEILNEKWNGEKYHLKVRIKADTKEVSSAIDRLRKDAQKSKELEDVRKKADEAIKEIERLKSELEAVKADKNKQKEYARAVNILSAVDWYKRGHALFIAGDYQEAIYAFSQTIKLNPKSARAYNMRGFLYSIHRDYKKALADFNYVTELDAKNVEAYVNRGFLYSMMKKYREAIKNFDKAIEIDPTYAGAYLKRGGAYVMIGNYQKAFQDIERAVELDSEGAIFMLKVSAIAGNKFAQDFLREKGISW